MSQRGDRLKIKRSTLILSKFSLNVPATARNPIFQPTGECRPIIRWNYFSSFSVGLGATAFAMVTLAFR